MKTVHKGERRRKPTGQITYSERESSALSGICTFKVRAEYPRRVSRSGWYSVASSADGTRLAATVRQVFVPCGAIVGWTSTSQDSGVTWKTYWSSFPSNSVIASSADSTKLVVAGEGSGGGIFGYVGGAILTATDSGTNWTESHSTRWILDLRRLVSGRNQIRSSGWRPNPPLDKLGRNLVADAGWAPPETQMAVASSADGSKIVAAVNGGGIYTWQITPTPVLNLTLLGGNLCLSWTVPSANFMLKQNPNVTKTNWTVVTTPTTLNYTNLQYQVMVPQPQGTIFYRLMSE